MWKSRSERLIERRRKDVEDEYAKCSAVSIGKIWNPSSEQIFREAEREARRYFHFCIIMICFGSKRRKLERKLDDTRREGMSSDEEETTSQEIDYKETMSKCRFFLFIKICS